MILALMIAPMIGGWRSVFYITGSLGLVMAVLIFFGVKEMPRGKAEPEFEGMQEIRPVPLLLEGGREIFKKKTMWFVFLQGFAGRLPLERHHLLLLRLPDDRNAATTTTRPLTMAPVILILAARLLRRRRRWATGCSSAPARAASSSPASGVICWERSSCSLAITTPVEDRTQFFILMCLTAIFMPFSSPNVIATVFDVTAPEVRSTAQAVEYFVENAGAAFAPIITGVIADALSLQTAILAICTVAWGLCFVFYLGALFTIDHDIHTLRSQMAKRAESM